jgi:hypothetical protein
MPLSYQKLVRALFLVAFSLSSIMACTHYHTNSVVIAALSLAGFISFDILEYLKKKAEPIIAVDYSPELAALAARQDAMETKFNTIANDAGLTKLAAAFRR